MAPERPWVWLAGAASSKDTARRPPPSWMWGYSNRLWCPAIEKMSVVSKESFVLPPIFVSTTAAFRVPCPDAVFEPSSLAGLELILTHTCLCTQCVLTCSPTGGAAWLSHPYANANAVSDPSKSTACFLWYCLDLDLLRTIDGSGSTALPSHPRQRNQPLFTAKSGGRWVMNEPIKWGFIHQGSKI